MKFQIFELVLEKAEELEVKLPTSAGSSKKQENSGTTSISAVLTAKAFDCVDHNKLWKILKEMGISDHLVFLVNLHTCIQVRKQQLELDMEQQTGSK